MTELTALPPPDPNEDGELRPDVGTRVWFTVFSAKTLVECIVELLKNGFDWNAEVINIVTDEARNKFRFVDNGQGMDAANRLAFVSVGRSTAASDRQSGTFGTGVKKFIFTFASHVRVVTAPEDEPDSIYVFEFTPEELAQAYSQQAGIKISRFKKTAKNWPLQHPFGTDITFTLKDPSSRSLSRGTQLAQKLADRLDNMLVETGMVLVNGQNLPSKQITGRIFRMEQPAESNPRIGRIKLEFYRPVKKSPDEDLLMTDRSIGEVSFRDTLVKLLLTQELRDKVPPLFLESEVCGLITAGFLHEHVTEDRTRYEPDGIANDERVVWLLRLLSRVEADVANHLGIKLRQQDSEDAQGREEVSQAIERLRRKWATEQVVTTDLLEGDDDELGRRRKKTQTTREPIGELPRMYIDRSEYELGEEINVRLVVPNGSTEGWHFYLNAARADPKEQSDDQVKLVASKLGSGSIKAVNPRTGESASTKYEVVVERVLHLASTHLSVAIGSHTTVHALNADKAKGAIGWELTEGHGNLAAKPRTPAAEFIPSRSGKAQIVAYDQENPDVRLACEVTITPGQGGIMPFRIRDQYFKEEHDAPNTAPYRKLVTIVNAGEGEVHRMVINPHAPSYDAAYKAGVLSEVILQQMSLEFAAKFGVDYADRDAHDIPSVMVEVQNFAALLFEEMLDG